MPISIQDIKDALDGLIAFELEVGKNYINISSMKLYNSQTEFLPGFLYIGKASDLPPSNQSMHAINIVCILDADLPVTYYEDTRINLLAVDSKMTLAQAYDKIQEVFIRAQDVSVGKEMLLDSLIHGRGVQHILDIGYGLLSNPIVILNGNKLLARTTNNQIDDPLWDELIIAGYFSPKTMDFFKEEWSQHFACTDGPILLQSKTLKHDRIISNIELGNGSVAHLVVVENNRPFRNEDYEIIALICKVISSELKHSKFYHNIDSAMYETLVYDILDGKICEDEIIDLRLSNLSWKTKKYLTVLVADILQYNNTYAYLSFFRDLFEQVTENCHTFIYNNLIVMLIGKDHENNNPMKDLVKLEEVIKENSIYCGIGRSFEKMSDLKKSYEQAIIALSIGQRLNKSTPIYNYCDLEIFHMIELLVENEDVMDFCSPALLSLIDHDKKNSTSYAETLYIYLKSGKNSNNSAKILHIHRNTMCYRLNRIEELTNIDWYNGNLLAQIYLSFGILKLKGLIDFQLA